MTDLNFDPVIGVIKAITSMAASPIKNQLERNERIIQIRKKLDFDPEHPPADFTGVYKYAIVEYGIDKPQPILELFRQKEIIQAFRAAFEEKDRSILQKAGQKFIDEYALGDEIKEQKIDIRQELTEFNEVFVSVTERTRTPAQVNTDIKIDNLLTIDHLWQQLVDRAIKSDRMKPEIANNLGMWNAGPKVPKGTPFYFVVNLPTAGYLILLEKNPEGQIWCLSPSYLAPPLRLEAGQVKLPLAYQNTFTADSVGREQMVAIISQHQLNFDWLPGGDDEPLEIRKEPFTKLLESLKSDFGVQIFYTEYRVIE